jgi:hypothetical protein
MSFDLQPTLKGELLAIRPLRPEDFHDLYAVASDPMIWEQHPIRDRYKEEVFKVFFREALESGGALIAIDSKSGRGGLACDELSKAGAGSRRLKPAATKSYATATAEWRRRTRTAQESRPT